MITIESTDEVPVALLEAELAVKIADMVLMNERLFSFHDECRKKHSKNVIIAENSIHRDQVVSRSAMNKLAQGWINELAVDQQNEGKYVILRVLKEGYSRAMDGSWLSVVEDQLSEAIGLELYNYPPDEVFAPGTIFIIKEPVVKKVMGFQFIRCDCPTDIAVLLPSHSLYTATIETTRWEDYNKIEDPLSFDPVPRSSGEWRLRGNELFKANKLYLAREAYCLGRKACWKESDPNARPIDNNLLQVYLSLGYYDLVIEKAKKNSSEYKAIFRSGKAHYALRQYEAAVVAFQKTIQLLKESGKLELEEYEENVKEINDMLQRAEARVKESSGEFSIDRIINEPNVNLLREIDCAEFHVPMKRLGEGRGLILETEVKKDDTLIISKSLATAFISKPDIEKIGAEMVNVENKWELYNDSLRAKVVSKLTKLVLKNPESFGSKLFELPAGKSNSQWLCDEEKKSEPICDVNRIKDIERHNGFTLYDAVSSRIKGFGIFYWPSFMNHSCEPNVDCKFYNDVMVVKALEVIEAGTELTLNYTLPEKNYQEGSDVLEKRGVVCTCPKCDVKKI